MLLERYYWSTRDCFQLLSLAQKTETRLLHNSDAVVPWYRGTAPDQQPLVQ